MTDAILSVISWINDMIFGLGANGSSLTSSLHGFMPGLYSYSSTIQQNVIMPVAYVVLALFFVLELHKASIRTDGMGGGTTNLGAEVVFKVMFKMVLIKIALDSTSLILNAVYNATTYLTSGIAGVLGGNAGAGGGLDPVALEPAIDALGFWAGLVILILCFIIFLVAMIAYALANIVIATRFIELYVYFAVAPIPLATLPSDEMSQIGKGFLKSFAAVCFQGVILFLVMSFFPILFNGIFASADAGDVMLALLGVLGYAIVLILAIFQTGKWAKSITGAM